MGTRALIVIAPDRYSDGEVVIYKHWDGYALGATLAQFLSGIRVVNGLPPGDITGLANGMGHLAAQIVAMLMEHHDDVYIEASGTRDLGEEYIYYVLPPAEDEGPPLLYMWDVWEKQLYRLLYPDGERERVTVQVREIPESLSE